MFGYNNFIDLIVVTFAIVISIVLHELAHGYVAMWNGDYTAKVNGRLSLNPLKHFDLVGFLMLMTVHFGYAKPVPVNPNNFKHRKLGMFLVAIAGVSLNFLLAFFSYLFYLLFLQINSSALIVQIFISFFTWMVLINLNLMIFNLLPIFPLDGYRVIEGVTRAVNPLTKFLRNYGQYILITLIGISIIVDLFNMPYYFDIMGMYINFFRNLFIRFFDWFWGLMF